MAFRKFIFWLLIILINGGFLLLFMSESDLIYEIPHPFWIWGGSNVALCILRLIDRLIISSIQNRKRKHAIEQEKKNAPKLLDALIAKTDDEIVKQILIARKGYLSKEYNISSISNDVYPFDIMPYISEKEEKVFDVFVNTCKQKINTQKVWFLSDVHASVITKSEATLSFGGLPYIKYDASIPIISTKDKSIEIAFYPNLVAFCKSNGEASIVKWRDLNVVVDNVDIKEFPLQTAEDATTIRQERNPHQEKRWDGSYTQPGILYVNKHYYLNYNVNDIVVSFSNSSAVIDFYELIVNAQQHLLSEVEYIKEDYYKNVLSCVRTFTLYLSELSNSEFAQFIISKHIEDSAGELIPCDKLVQILTLSDVISSINKMKGEEVTLTQREGLGALLLSMNFAGQELIDFDKYLSLSKGVFASAKAYADTTTQFFSRDNERISLLAPIIAQFNEDMALQYLIYLYRLLSITAKADNIVTEQESGFLKQLFRQVQSIDNNVSINKDVIATLDVQMELGGDNVRVGQYIVREQKCVISDIQATLGISRNRVLAALKTLERIGIIETEGTKRKVLIEREGDVIRLLRGKKAIGNNITEKENIEESGSPSAPREKETVNEKQTKNKLSANNELDTLIGLDSVKKEVQTLTNFIKIQQKREEQGLKSSSLSYHCVFTGNPGTGKTTVARIVADIYKELGVLKKGHLVETDRAGLVAEYVGQTAIKTNKIIDSALDGVLFIDEAYSLVDGGESDYGKEAIATLLKRMEDDRDRLVVILAGYTEDMKRFIDSNPGLQSRFNRYIEFPDYTAEELLQIFEVNMRKFDYKITDDAKEQLKQYFADAVAHKDKNFGNGRFVRNVFEKVLEHQANRLASQSNLTTEQLSEITIEDLPK